MTAISRSTRRKKFLHSARMGIRGNVVILRFAPQQQVAHAAAHKVGFESGSVKCTADIRREFARSHAAIMPPNGEAMGIQKNV